MLKRFDTQVNEPINQDSVKVSTVVNQANKKTLLICYKTLGTSVTISPPSETLKCSLLIGYGLPFGHMR